MSKSVSSEKKPYSSVRPDVQLPAQEEEILSFWERNKIFEKSVSNPAGQTANIKPYTFYDGPPFATGLPHYGHLLAGTLKDIVPRYWTMKGYSVPRRFGWDCHGLPVENEINKSLKITSNKDVFKMGVDKYNAACRGIVQRYSHEWKQTVRRIGRWVDMENAYFTMDIAFMESVWWVFKQMFDQGLIYPGYKVVPYSTGLSTALSNFEANSNYKQVQDPAIFVHFPLDSDSVKKLGLTDPTSLIAWTTTPWTLPSNMGLAVGKDIEYVAVEDLAKKQIYIVAESLWRAAFGKNTQDNSIDAQFKIIKKWKGQELLGLTYQPLFDYFKNKKSDGAFRVIWSDHVTTESGTGIVQMAPAFGEDDYYACQREGIPVVNPVDDDGMFTAEVPPYAGKRVKEADKEIIAELKKSGRLIKQDTLVHSYPYCSRTDTPLIYRAVSSWFVRVEKVKDRLIKNNQTTNWVPDHLRDGRFGNWLENARDWAISRNRFWGTPLPIWQNAEGETLCIGSREELEKLSGKKINDLHMDVVDHILIPSPTGKSPLKRISPVLDCWFESGSMPYAQLGYPRTGKDVLEKTFPADFIAEGLDQTRGWFYTLMVIGTVLFDKAPFKNVIVNGLILAEDGKKMSKSLKNYPDPMEVLNKHGADALRLYLIDSPVVKAQELKFSEKGVNDIVRKILLRWWNSYSFFVNYANVDGFIPKGDYANTPNLLDQWILSRLNSLVSTAETEMEAYRLYNVVPLLLGFIEELTNTYIRFNRSHFWQNGMPEDKRLAYETLHHVLITLSKVMAPFAPYLSEVTFQNLKQVLKSSEESVHLSAFPSAETHWVKPELEDAVKVMDALVTLGRNHREKIKVKAKIPLRSMKIIHRDPKILENLKKFEPYFQDELNIRKIDYTSDEDSFVSITAKANFPALGKRAGAKMKSIAAGIQKFTLPQLLSLEKGQEIQVDGESISLSDVIIQRAAKGERPDLSIDQWVSIEVDPHVGADQVEEGLAREVMRKIQQARKNADFQLDDRISLELHCDGDLKSAVETHLKLLQSETLTEKFAWNPAPSGQHTEEAEIETLNGTAKIKIGVTVQK
jgi:isoleucyl-tRNA synthetase